MKRVHALLLASAFALGLGLPALLPAALAMRQEPAAAPAQNRNLPRTACRAIVKSGVAPDSLRLCETAEVTVTLGITCPSRLPVHLFIAVDRSRSIALNDQFLAAIRRSAGQVLDQLDFNHPETMAGVLSHGFEVSIESELSHNRGRAQGAVNGVQYVDADFGEDPAEAVEVAQRLLEDARGDVSPLELILLYGDGCDTTVPSCDAASRRAAQAAKGAGIAVATVCFKESARQDCADYRAMASDPSLYFEAPASRLPRAIADFQDLGRQLVVNTVDLVDVLAPGIRLVPGSAQPVPQVSGQQLKFPTWRRVAPGSLLEVRYQVQGDAVGASPLRVSPAAVELVDNLDRWSGALPLPGDALTVTGPCGLPSPTVTATPAASATATATEPATPTEPLPSATSTPPATATATASPTATATPVPVIRVVHLPILLKSGCRPEEVHTDVVLAIDASSSMTELSGGRTKLAAAQAAARQFVDLLALGKDQAAVVGFNSEALLYQALTGDAAALRRAIDGLVVRQGTRIDEALLVAGNALAEGPARPGNSRAIVLLTDGRQEGGEAAAVLAAAGWAKGQGASLFTIGLGEDVDGALLRQIASSPDTYYHSPAAADLEAIYRQIAFALPCPGGAAWGR